jgi:hypothetical protein
VRPVGRREERRHCRAGGATSGSLWCGRACVRVCAARGKKGRRAGFGWVGFVLGWCCDEFRLIGFWTQTTRARVVNVPLGSSGALKKYSICFGANV